MIIVVRVEGWHLSRGMQILRGPGNHKKWQRRFIWDITLIMITFYNSTHLSLFIWSHVFVDLRRCSGELRIKLRGKT